MKGAVMCECGEQVWIKKTGECKGCYSRRYYQESHVPKPRTRMTEEERRAKRRTPEYRAKANEYRRKKRKEEGREPDPTRAARKARRRARQYNTTVHAMPSNYADVIKGYYGGMCQACGATEQLEIDHVVPLAMGGEHTLHNMQVLCRSCNGKKSARNAADYRGNRRLVRVIELKRVSLTTLPDPAPSRDSHKSGTKLTKME